MVTSPVEGLTVPPVPVVEKVNAPEEVEVGTTVTFPTVGEKVRFLLESGVITGAAAATVTGLLTWVAVFQFASPAWLA